MEETKHLQSILLKMIKYIDEICREHDIEYYLLAGSSLGSVRHKGFIPWDDDLDIVMTYSNYNRFIELCESQLDHETFFFQQGEKDWSLPFSKIRLKGTYMKESEMGYSDKRNQGIFVDIFRLDNVSNNKIVARWQYFCAKVFLTSTIRERKYKSASLRKKIFILLSYPLIIPNLKRFFQNQVEKYNNKETDFYGCFYCRSNFKSAVMRKSIYGRPVRIPFENLNLPVQEDVHEYLRRFFGDYMQLPPEKDRVGHHAIEIDFGKY